jgi:hypothetical protein
MAKNFVDMFVTAIIAIALFAPLNSYVSDAAADPNISTTAAVLLGLVPVLYIILLVAGFAYMLRKK